MGKVDGLGARFACYSSSSRQCNTCGANDSLHATIRAGEGARLTTECGTCTVTAGTACQGTQSTHMIHAQTSALQQCIEMCHTKFGCHLNLLPLAGV